MPDFVPLSACVSDTANGATSQCAIEVAQCPAGFSFELANVALFTHLSCNDIEDIETGRCDDTGRCAYDENGCKDPSTYQDPRQTGSQGCTVALDQDSGEYTRHGKCNRQGQDLCMVGDCSDGILSPHVQGCHCGAAWTGACVDEQNANHYCAVSEDSCTGNTVFRNAHELFRGGEIDCRLCSHLYYDHPGVKQISEPAAFGVGVFFGAVPVFLVLCCWMRFCRPGTKVPESTNGMEMS